MPTTATDRAVLYAFKAEGGRPWYLLLRRADGLPGAGTWDTIEAVPFPGESSARAVIRALVDETALDPQGLWALDRAETIFEHAKDLIRIRPVYAALVTGDITLIPKHGSSRWLSDREMLSTLKSAQQRASLEEVNAAVATAVARGQEPDPRLRVV